MIKHINIKDLYEKSECYCNFFNNIDVKATNSSFKIYNNYNSNCILYIRILSDNLYLLLNYFDFEIPLNINFSELNRFYKDEFKLFFNVFDKEILSLPHGFYFEYYQNGSYVIKRILNNNCEIINDPVESLEYVLKKYVKSKNIAISFSSGLDSTAILYACKSVFKDSNLCAYTWKSDHCSNEDLINSRKICNKLGIKLIEFHLDSKYLLTDIKPENFVPFPSSHLGFANFLQYMNSKISLYFNNESFVNINGHGGDHIFFESLPLQYVIKELKYKPTKLNEYLNLYSLNYFVLFRALKYSKDFEIFREYSIHEALYQTAMLNPDLKKYNYFFPYTTEEMITCAEKYTPIQTFNSKFSRVHFRNALKDFYNSEDFFRKSKGHMTGAYQNTLLENSTKFKKIFDKGYLSKNKDFDLDKVICDMELSALGVGGISFNLMTAIIFELQIKLIKEKCYELS